MACWPEGDAKRLPRSPSNRSAEGVPRFAPATSPRVRRRPSSWPPSRRKHPVRESLSFGESVHRSPAHIRQIGAGGVIVGLYTAGFSRTPFHLVLPDPTRLAVPGRPVVLRAACHPSLRLQGRAAPRFIDLLRQADGGALSSPPGSSAPR